MKQIKLNLDSSQISAYYACPTIWGNRDIVLVNKIDPAKTNAPGDAAAMGTYGHKLLEIYYRDLCILDDRRQAIMNALAFDPNAADTEAEDEHHFPLPIETIEAVKDRFINYTTLIPPEKDYITHYRKIHRIEWDAAKGKLVDRYVKDPYVEKGFSYLLYESREYLFTLEGRIDWLGTSRDGTELWMDHKWQMQAHELWVKSIQFRNYSLATGRYLGVVNYLRMHKKLDQTTLVRRPISFSPVEMHHWRLELIDKYVEIAKTITSNDFPKNRDSCKGGFGRPCQFTALCDEYNPVIRENIRKRDYIKAKEWRPW